MSSVDIKLEEPANKNHHIPYPAIDILIFGSNVHKELVVLKAYLRMMIIAIILVVVVPMLLLPVLSGRMNIANDNLVATEENNSTGTQAAATNTIISVLMPDGTISQMDLNAYLTGLLSLD